MRRDWGPQDWRRLLSAIRRGLATYGAATVAHDQHASATALRSRQIRPRRIAVIGSTGGVGTTTAAALLASVLAAARDDQTLLLTMHSDACDGAVRLGIPHAPSVTEVLAGLRRHGRIPPTPVTRSGLRVLSAPPPGSTVAETGLAGLLDVAASGHASVVVDAGVASRVGEFCTVAELFDTVVLVCATSTDAVAATTAVLARWRGGLPAQNGTRLILMPVRSRVGTGIPGSDAVERLLVDGAAAHVMAHDRELGRGATIDLSTVSGRSLTTALELGADIMGHR
ncbi:MAG: hypothetical protein M3492_01425 [Actinomycetota bacterium]|nr:hypothetical protein [Actinomycetota bacterium]